MIKPSYYELAGGQDLLDVIPDDEKFIFCKWSAMKYLTRVGKKDRTKAIEDLRKAETYLLTMAEIITKENNQDACAGES